MKKTPSTILVCALPNVSLIRQYPYMEVALGPSVLTGALKGAGYMVDYYDLNAVMNNACDYDEEFSDEDNEILSDLARVKGFTESPKTASILYKRAIGLLGGIGGDSYGCICLSLERKTKKYFVFERAIFFAIVLGSLLKKKYNCPIFLGGSVACYAFGFFRLQKIMQEFENIPIDGFFVRAKAREFVEFINAFNNNEPAIVADKYLGAIFSDRFSRILQRIPIEIIKDNKRRLAGSRYIYHRFYLPAQRKEELAFDLKAILPKPILAQYPALQRIDSFCVAPHLSSWGCPFRCGFCMIGSFNFGFLRPKQAVDELERVVVEYSVTDFRFYNSQINFNEKYVFEFCNEIKRRNLKIRFSDSGNLFFASKEIFKALKEAGCIKIWFGLETLSPRLQKIFKKALNREKIISGLTNSADAGIWNAVNLIINFPFETDSEYMDLVDFINSNKDIIDCWECNNFMLLQDSMIFRQPKHFGVEILKTENLIKGYNFNEIKGLRWEEKLKRGERLLNKFRETFDYYRNSVFMNDYLLFGFSKALNDKSEVRALFDSLVAYFQNNTGSRSLDKSNGNVENMSLKEYARYIHPEFL